ncbi:hypothetical protein [Streptomyces sp. NPDC000983]|uniref:hypothetical protein n=1 Tax=Streptomyces sp. NPDC000983 TaxID=3154373 RepID=UPI00332A84E1
MLDASHLMPLDALPEVAGEHARAAGFTDLLIYVADLERRGLHLLTGANGVPPDAARDIRVEGTNPRTGLSVRPADLLLPERGGRHRLVGAHRGVIVKTCGSVEVVQAA